MYPTEPYFELYLYLTLPFCIIFNVHGSSVPGPVVSPVNPCIIANYCDPGFYCTTDRCVPNCAIPPPVPPIPPVTCANITCPPCLPQCVMANAPNCTGWLCAQGPVCVPKSNANCTGRCLAVGQVCRMVYASSTCNTGPVGYPQPKCITIFVIPLPTLRQPIPIPVIDPAGPVEEGGK